MGRHRLSAAPALCLLLALCTRCDAVFFKLKQGQQRCFIELLRKDEVIIVTYASPDQSDLPRKSVFEGKCDKEGRFAFTARTDMEHSLCWSVEGHSLGQEFRVHLDIKEGTPEEDVADLARVEHLGAMELKVRKLNEDIKRIKKEQAYFKQREARFRETVDSTNFRAQWFSVIQIAAMGVVTALHLSYLAHYFVKKKIV